MTVDLLWAWVAAANESPRGGGIDNYALKEVSNILGLLHFVCILRGAQRFSRLSFCAL